LNYRTLKTTRSIWVVIIGLELLSLACPGLGLGSYYVITYAYVTLSLLWLFCPISVENRIWGDGNETCGSSHNLICGPVHEATTHENNTTMSLYGYDLVWYVVEPSLAYQSVVQIEWTLLGSA
jgi:hypothetical protein